jgi:DNA-binding CsgD family transcriptional regulator
MDDLLLTPRQREVLAEVCLGKSNKQIARTLGLAEITVKLHLIQVFKALGVRTRGEAMAVCLSKPSAVEALTAENERLRQALRDLIKQCEEHLK